MMGSRGGIALAVLLIGLLAAPFLYTAAGNSLFRKPPRPSLALPTNAEKCLAPTAFMRKNHMKLLVHARDDIVRNGARLPHFHIENCKTCHTKRAEFCDRCHSYAGVNPECWHCHYLP